MLTARNWISLDIPFTGSLPQLTTKAHFGQIIFGGTNISNFFADNIYFWSNPVVPPVAAPVPTRPAANVLSVFSDSYTNPAGFRLLSELGSNHRGNTNTDWWQQHASLQQLQLPGLATGRNQNLSTYQFCTSIITAPMPETLNVYLICPPGSPGGTALWEPMFSFSCTHFGMEQHRHTLIAIHTPGSVEQRVPVQI